MLQTEEERQSKILEADYSKVDIDTMVQGLNIPNDLKRKLNSMLLKHDTLFSGGLGKPKLSLLILSLNLVSNHINIKDTIVYQKCLKDLEKMNVTDL